MSTAEKIIDNLEKDIERYRDDLVNAVTDNISKSAQRNFNSFIKYASTDYPYIHVASFPLKKEGQDRATRLIECIGTQVLFIEFGVGAYNSTKKTVEHTDDGTVVSFGEKPIGTFTRVKVMQSVKWGNTTGINTMFMNVDTAQRPHPVVPLGTYGKGHGQDEMWIRPSATGIPNLTAGETHVHTRNGDVREDVVWTTGHPPARALYRAVRSTMKKLAGGKL